MYLTYTKYSRYLGYQIGSLVGTEQKSTGPKKTQYVFLSGPKANMYFQVDFDLVFSGLDKMLRPKRELHKSVLIILNKLFHK